MRALIALVVVAAAPALSGPQGQVMAAMEASAAGWNAGDLDRFVAIYADDATFVVKDGVLRGKAAIARASRTAATCGASSASSRSRSAPSVPRSSC